ncbi:MAG: inositol monophosphatase [Anaerolineae bacterium]|nr:inositol monophosphatase [Anaerolineae bacterium]
MTAALMHHTPATPQGELALRAAYAAGRVLAKKFYGARDIHSKGFRDLVTDADFAADRAARRVLERAFPEYSIRSEEDAHPSADAEFAWLLDPLDGTTNYSRGFPIFSVSLALVHRGQPIVGAVLDPLRRECFFAERGHGAYLNGRRIHAGRVATFDRAIVGCEMARDPDLRALGLEIFESVALPSMTARLGGSAALSLCYVAAGRLDAYLQPSLSPWDVAAGILIVRQAGARVTHFNGKPATLRGGGYLAGAPRLFPQFLKQVTKIQGTSGDLV